MNRLYNEEIKEKFLSQYDNDATQATIRNVFNKTELVERVLEKDIMDFSLDEIGKAILNTNPHNVNVARSTGRFLSQYLSWTISERLRKNTLNPLQGVLPEWYDNFVDKSKKIHYSYSEFLELLKELQNAQDQAFLFLIWEGIIGERFSEIQQLTYDNVNFDEGTIFVKDRNQYIKVSEDCIKYIEKAYKEHSYYQYNMKTKEFSSKELLPSGFILKNVKSPRSQEGGNPVGMSVLYTRLHAIADYLDLQYLTPNALKQSGMIWMAYNIYEDEKILAYDQLAKIGEKYNFSTISNENNGKSYTYFNTYLMRDFMTQEVFEELYNTQVEFAKK